MRVLLISFHSHNNKHIAPHTEHDSECGADDEMNEDAPRDIDAKQRKLVYNCFFFFFISFLFAILGAAVVAVVLLHRLHL